jgi:hypothetical protein
LSVTVRVPKILPTAVGVNVTLMLQVAPTAILAPQVVVTPKLVEATIPVTNSEALPKFVRVTVCAALVLWSGSVGKVKLSGESDARGAEIPVPDSGTVCGLLGALSVKVTEPTAAPLVVGVNVTLKVHTPPTAKDTPQVLAETANGPLAVIEVKASANVPLFEIVTVCGRLAVFNACEPKLKMVGDSPTMG